MRMGSLEKNLVNSEGHSRDVAAHAVRMLRNVPGCDGRTYLDVGCGNGLATLHVARAFDLRTTGVDVDPEQIALAERAAEGVPNARFLSGDATRLPFEDRSFDIVATNKMTHHIPDWETALREMIRVTRPGGHLIYSDIALPVWAARVGRAVAAGHAGWVTPADIVALLRERAMRFVFERRAGLLYEVIARVPA